MRTERLEHEDNQKDSEPAKHLRNGACFEQRVP